MKPDILDIIYNRYFVDCDKAENICKELNIDRNEFTKLSKQISEERPVEIKEMRRIRNLFNNKKEVNFNFSGFREFYKWYLKQFSEQKGKCYYCKTEEKVIAKILSAKLTLRERPNRGKHLEVERRDSLNNEYSADNCVLACYFCNNDKSSIFNENEYFEYLKDRKSFFEKLYNNLK